MGLEGVYKSLCAEMRADNARKGKDLYDALKGRLRGAQSVALLQLWKKYKTNPMQAQKQNNPMEVNGQNAPHEEAKINPRETEGWAFL